MIIKHNMTALNGSRQYFKNVKDSQKMSEKLSSGYRINRSADDVAGLPISEEMRGQIRGMNRGSSNCSDAMSLIQTADGALEEMHSILDRLKELSVQSANDTNTDSDREAIQYEVTGLLKEIDKIGSATEFNNKKLFHNGAKELWVQSGANSTGGSRIDIDEINTKTLNLDQISLATGDGAQDANFKVDKAIDKVSQLRAYMGAEYNRLEHSKSVDDYSSENLQASESRIRDLNMGDGMVSYSRSTILMQAGEAMIAQANQAVQGVLSLLQ